MDKEKEVKVYNLIENAPIETYPTHVVDLNDYEAERTKREEAEKKLDDAIAVLKLCANRSDKCDYSDLANLTLLSFKELK